MPLRGRLDQAVSLRAKLALHYQEYVVAHEAAVAQKGNGAAYQKTHEEVTKSTQYSWTATSTSATRKQSLSPCHVTSAQSLRRAESRLQQGRQRRQANLHAPAAQNSQRTSASHRARALPRCAFKNSWERSDSSSWRKYKPCRRKKHSWRFSSKI